MTDEQIKAVILNEVDALDINSWHGINKDNLRQLLVDPKSVGLSTFSGEVETFWLVFDEDPLDPVRGYLIVYDEKSNMFGIATKTSINGKDVGHLMGLYGSFVDALNNM